MRQKNISSPAYGDIWLVELGPVTGREFGKTRPVLIVSNDANNRYAGTITMLPLTSQPAKRQYLHEVIVPAGEAGLSYTSRIKADQIRTVDKSRVVYKLGQLKMDFHADVNRALRYHLNIV